MASSTVNMELQLSDIPKLRQFIEDCKVMLAQHREVVRLCQQHADPRSNPATHELASKILVILEEREVGK